MSSASLERFSKSVFPKASDPLENNRFVQLHDMPREGQAPLKDVIRW